MNKEKKLQVRDLTISFRTVNGKLQAVRDISFDLYKGETLAIVGESGSGKSATSKTILGISAANTIIEGGEILYDGKDLLKISEEDFHAIRGDKIAMVFQDPLSSLNPIMRVGKQLTEAMLLKNKANRKECKTKVNRAVKELDSAMKSAGCSFESSRFSTFKKIIQKQCAHEAPFDQAYSNAAAGAKAAEDMILAIDKEALKNPVSDATELKNYCLGAIDEFVVKDGSAMKNLASGLVRQARAGAKSQDFSALKSSAEKLKVLLDAGLEKEKPDFFDLGCKEVLGDGTGMYMSSFISDTKAALRYNSGISAGKIREALKELEKGYQFFSGKMPEKAASEKTASDLSAAVEASIDPLETVKESLAYTFAVSISNAVEVYYNGEKANVAEQKRFAQQTAKYERLEAKGRAPEGKVAPIALVDLEVAQENILNIISNMKEQFERKLTTIETTDYDAHAQNFMKWLKDTAMGEVHKITQSMAKDTAIRIMEQVGITEARKRYRQYPFEFSGGMRQRIVIAISLTADPDILICDEPTTALDVTIQAQILELINKLKKERDLSVIFITHDLGVVANMADRIAVMYAGKIVEYGKSEEVFYHPAHPYTWALLASIPDLDSKGEKLEAIPGTPPNMIYPPKGDAFAERNKYALEIDFELQPPMFQISDTHYAATWLQHPDAPKVEMPSIVKDRIARMGNIGGGNNE